jgi:hypothetical protein
MLVTMRAKAAGAVVAGLGLLVACGGGHTSASPQASKIAAHLRLLAGTADFRQVPAGGAMTKSAMTACGDNEHDPSVWREYRVASAEAAASDLYHRWVAAGWRADHRSNLPGDLTVAQRFGGWTAGLSAFVVDATHLEVSGNDLDNHCFA